MKCYRHPLDRRCLKHDKNNDDDGDSPAGRRRRRRRRARGWGDDARDWRRRTWRVARPRAGRRGRARRRARRNATESAPSGPPATDTTRARVTRTGNVANKDSTNINSNTRMVYDCATSGSDDSCKLNASPETIFAKCLYIAYGDRAGTRKCVTYNRFAATSHTAVQMCLHVHYATTGTNTCTYCLE